MFRTGSGFGAHVVSLPQWYEEEEEKEEEKEDVFCCIVPSAQILQLLVCLS